MQRFTISIDQNTYAKLVNYWHQQKFKSQTQGVLDLIAKGLNIVENAGEYQPPPLELSEDIQKIVDMYQALDEGDQGEIRGEMKQMLKATKYARQKNTKVG
jgi:hypothetical protein